VYDRYHHTSSYGPAKERREEKEDEKKKVSDGRDWQAIDIDGESANA
jgi:hypothetical protein